MKLFDAIEQIVRTGKEVSFKSDINQLRIKIQISDGAGNKIANDQCLPMSDHFYEEEVVSCLEWMDKEVTRRFQEHINKPKLG